MDAAGRPPAAGREVQFRESSKPGYADSHCECGLASSDDGRSDGQVYCKEPLFSAALGLV